jgi:hypothetical protein
MNINFIRSLRQQDLKIFNHKELKYLDQIITRPKENQKNLENLSMNKIKKRIPSLDRIFPSKAKKIHKIEEAPSYQNLFLINHKKESIKHPTSVNKVNDNKILDNPGLTKNNFFLTSNISTAQTKQTIISPFSKNNPLSEEENTFLRKVLFNLLKALNSKCH